MIIFRSIKQKGKSRCKFLYETDIVQVSKNQFSDKRKSLKQASYFKNLTFKDFRGVKFLLTISSS